MSDKLDTAKPRASWRGKWGFILAAAASAVGLGNMWRFPYLAAKYGGGTFLITYIVLVVTFGFALMMAETALGRMTKQSVTGAFSKFGGKFAFIGILAALVPLIITPYYCVIGGWVTKYMVSYLTELPSQIAADGYFTGFILSPGPDTFLWMIVFVAVVAIVVSLGVNRGIENLNRVLMPALIVMAIGISLYSLTIPGAIDGLKYYLIPDVTKFSPELVVAAMGQMFFSLSLAMGIMVTYGSYFSKEDDLEHSVRRIEIFDTGIAILAGFMIIPISVAVMGSAEVVSSKAGPGLMFGVLPVVFNDLGPAAPILGFIFFLLVFFAALTSAISLFETIVSCIQDFCHCSRTTSIILNVVWVVVLGIICNLGYNSWLGIDPMYSIFGIGAYQDHQILDFMDFISNTIMMPIVALLTCFFIGYVIKPKTIIDHVKESSEFKSEKLFTVMIKYIAPIFVILILIFYVMDTIGMIHL
ncbi:MAG: sodium-dependent transporter [Coriobacteriia bacterium]|nr:sodium-dependent transporter [Coriobacteriia bacterium]